MHIPTPRGIQSPIMPQPSAAILRRALTALILSALCVAAGPPKHGDITKSAVDSSALRAGHKAWAAVVVEIQPGYHAQSHTPLDENFIKFELKPDENPSLKFGDAKYPPAELEDYPALGKLSVYQGRVVVHVPLEVKPDAKPGPIEITGKIRFQACDDKVCYPPETPKFSIKTEIVPADAPVKPNEPDLFKGLEKASLDTATSAPEPKAATAAAAAPTPAPVDASARMVAWQFLIAFLAGIVFNVMPCVLPVLPLKAVGFYNAAQHSRAKSLAFGATFSAGLIATFAAFGILIFGFQRFSWGQLFTYTWFQAFIVLALLGLAASTFGLFTVKLPTAVYNVTPSHETYAGNFLFGILTAVLSTPCTFGLFVGLLAWAIATGSATIGVLMLVMVGVGMAFPYFLLSAMPEVARRFPRTGPWAELVKQLMGFLLVLAAVYFARPFLGRFAPEEEYWWLLFAVVVLAAGFLTVRTFQFAATAPPKIIGVTLALVLVAGSFLAAKRLAFRPYQWQPFTTAALDKARAENRIVLVEFTALWCANCQVVEASVLHSRPIVEAVRDHDVLMLKADVTDNDAPGRPLLEKLNPAGSIPLTAIFTPGSDRPIELPGIYSTTDLTQALTAAATQPPPPQKPNALATR